ncbi:hypothetical protein RRG08_044587 [Elysia crispata]|uniref:Protein Njmu-R1 n=1 Tax=Elysia crispata TaxID=231223 RepID=A0AAE0ZTF2_9GAST|nr:hypothetical protein RRG08_044587 [Elysia crispata]
MLSGPTNVLDFIHSLGNKSFQVKMTDSASDTSSIRNLDVGTGGSEDADNVKGELGTEDVTGKLNEKIDGTKRFYALYSVQPQRKFSSTESEEDQLQENTQSLSIIATNLIAAAEIDLRKSLSSWLTKDKGLPRKGKFASMGLNMESEYSSSAICYSSVIETPAADSQDFNSVSAGSPGDSGANQQQFVVSFISFQDSSLDLFRSEFDQYVQGLVPLLDKELFVTCQAPSLSTESANNNASSGKPLTFPDLSQLGTGIQTYLEQWPTSVLGYLTRTLQFMGADVEHLIYAALSNASLQISGTTAEMEEDIKRFFRCCSLSSLVEQLQPDNTSHKSITGSSDSAELWQLQAPIISLTFKSEEEMSLDSSTGKVIMDPLRSCTFCKNAADKLMSLDVSNMTKIRDFLESIKLAFVHNLNKLKRFLKQAEVDYYALYGSLCYLKKCGCGELLMQYVKLDGESETLSVLAALEIFISEMNQNLT